MESAAASLLMTGSTFLAVASYEPFLKPFWKFAVLQASHQKCLHVLQEGMLLDEPVGPSMDHTMEEDRIGFGSGRPKRRR